MSCQQCRRLKQTNLLSCDPSCNSRQALETMSPLIKLFQNLRLAGMLRSWDQAREAFVYITNCSPRVQFSYQFEPVTFQLTFCLHLVLERAYVCSHGCLSGCEDGRHSSRLHSSDTIDLCQKAEARKGPFVLRKHRGYGLVCMWLANMPLKLADPSSRASIACENAAGARRSCCLDRRPSLSPPCAKKRRGCFEKLNQVVSDVEITSIRNTVT